MIDEMINLIDARYRARIYELETRLQRKTELRYRDEVSEHRLIAAIDRLRLAHERARRPLINVKIECLLHTAACPRRSP